MPAGGVRRNAGRPLGGQNRIDREAREKAKAAGITPLDYMLQILRNEDNPRDVRLDAAKAAAPYLHAKLNSVDMQLTGKNGGAMEMVTRIELVAPSLNEDGAFDLNATDHNPA
jgi:hypothetical protein